MTLTITLTNDQLGGDINLSATSTQGPLGYALQTPATGAESVTETIRFYFHSGLQAARLGSGFIRDIEQYFEMARRRQRLQTGARIWLKVDPDDGSEAYRTEVLDGRLAWPADILHAHNLPSDRGEVAIIITHRPWWEKDEEFEMPLSVGGTYATGGRTIQNTHDAAGTNWVAWEAWGALGDVPAPLRIEFTSTDPSLSAHRFLMAVTHEVHDTGDYSLDWVLEGEDDTASTGTDTANAFSSSDFYRAAQWTATVETKVFTWSITNGGFAGGNPFRAVARFVSNNYDNLYARVVIRGNGDTFSEVWRGPLIKVAYSGGAAEELTDLGLIPALPPGIPDGLAVGGMYLDLYFLRNTAGTHTVNLDHLTLMPMDGGFRAVEGVGSNINIGDTEKLIDDGIYERTYKDDSSIYSTGWAHDGNYLALTPGKGGRLTLLWEANNNTAPATLSASVRLYYRPRRLTL